MARSRNARLTALTLSNLILPVAVLVFASGFFPFKPLLPGLATFQDVKETALWGEEQPEAVFDRVIFMVVDALRSDFVYGQNSSFDFTQSLIRDGAAIPFTAHATPPTVTMPRVKAITTGSVPSFADLIFNLDESGSGSTLATQDTWLAQIKAKGGKLVFYGDDTWLRLFPGDFFERSDGTSSFFVSDFTEVDTNVTRHVPEELRKDDWNAMIMHYLGLDHIGHKTGPNGPNMLPKQREMDDIVREIYQAMETKEHHANTLLVLAGDHGMNAGGNHGGSGPGETEPALLFVSPKLSGRRNRPEYQCPTTPKDGTDFHYYRKVEQSDIVPTLAGLMRMPVSKNSLGVFIEEFASCWSRPSDGVQVLHQNSNQMKHIIEAAFGSETFRAKVALHEQRLAQSNGMPCVDLPGGEEDELACYWAAAERSLRHTTSQGVQDWDMASKSLLQFLAASQEMLSSVASSYNIPRMCAGMAISAISLLLAILSLPRLWPPSLASAFLILTTLLYGVMIFASSYVEEEQHFWYWLTPAWTTLLTVRSVCRIKGLSNKLRIATAGACLLAVHRLAVRWNQTGQKHAGEPDIAHAVFPDYFVLMWLLVLATYGYTCMMLTRRTFLDLLAPEIAVSIALALVVPAIVFKLNFTYADAPELVRGLAYQIRAWSEPFSLVQQGQVAFALQGIATVTVAVMAIVLSSGTILSRPDGPAVSVTLSERLHYLLTLFLITQTRAQNIPLFLGLELQYHALSIILPAQSQEEDPRRSSTVSAVELAISSLLLSHAYFFCMGGSNSISSVDLSNAYNGVADYNIFAVGVLLFASNWTGPIWWCSAAVLLTFTKLSGNLDAGARKRAKGDRRLWVEEERDRLRKAASSTLCNEGRVQVPEHWLVYVASMTAFVSASLLAVMAACTALRTHLFIWTVFSPKYLYAMAWSGGWHMIICIGLGSLLRWMGQIA